MYATSAASLKLLESTAAGPKRSFRFVANLVQNLPFAHSEQVSYIRSMRSALASAALLSILGCSESTYFVPGPDFEQSIELVAEKTEIRVGQTLPLPVTRASGGWLEVPASEVDTAMHDVCYWIEEPPVHEKDVSLNMAFIIEPRGHHRLSLQHRSSDTRTVVFDAPGRYSIRAHSALWCAPGAGSNTIEVIVRE